MANEVYVAKPSLVSRSLGVWIFDRERGEFVKEMIWDKWDGGKFIEPVIHIHPAQAQTLMDQLWDAGLRPSAAAGSVGQLAAVQAHLQDLRVLYFSREGIDLPR